MLQPLPLWLDAWLRDHVRVRLRPLTQLAYARAARNFTEALGHRAPGEITEGHLASIVRAWLSEGRSIHRIRADVRSFTMALEWARAPSHFRRHRECSRDGGRRHKS